MTYWDVGTQSYRSHIPGAPEWVYRHLASYSLVDRDDIVFVRVR